MVFPAIDIIKRDREYNNYSIKLRARVVYGYLFQGMSHRALDREILGLDSKYSKGYQSMGILHFLGLKNKHKNIFKSYSLEQAIVLLEKDGNQDYKLILKHLQQYENENNILDAKVLEENFEKEINKSRKDSSKNRKERLKKSSVKPAAIQVETTMFQRNPDVVAEVLFRANGICEKCSKPAPFLRKKDDTPYLEVHHLTFLSSGGEDTVENAIALCPNCHREMHFG